MGRKKLPKDKKKVQTPLKALPQTQQAVQSIAARKEPKLFAFTV